MTHDLKHLTAMVEEIFANEQFLSEPVGLYKPIDYTLRLGGKRIRPMMLLASGCMFGAEPEELHDAAIGIELFHNFTLLHDDLMDRSPLRRWQPTVYTKWDDNTAVLSGDTMFAMAWRCFLRINSPHSHAAMRCFCDTAIEVCEGQQKDMDFERMTMADGVGLGMYMEMIRQKTAVLLAASLEIGALLAGAQDEEVERIRNFGLHLGLAFQLQDDLLDGYGDTAVFGKKTGQDIRDNKKTYLPLLARTMCNNQQRDELDSLFSAKKNMDEEEKVRRVMAIYNTVGLRRAVDTTIAEEFSHAVECLDSVGAEEGRKRPLRDLVQTLFCRKK